MTPGYLAGQYTAADISCDVPAIAGRAGAACVIGAASRLDPARRLVLVEGRALEYDLVSFNIGSLLTGAEGEDARFAEPIKPLHRAARLRGRMDALARAVPSGRGDASPVRVVIIGAGAGGVEVACAAAAALDRAGRPREITLVERGDGVPAGYAPRFQARARRVLEARGVQVRLGARGAARRAGAVDLDDGTVLPSDLSVWLTGPEGAAFLAESGLPVDSRGFLWTDERLRSTADPRVFAVGDCGTMRAHPQLAKSGVYAVRQAPMLWHNLRAAAGGGSLRAFRPQHEFLSILNTCDGRALLQYRGFISWSRWAWRLKDRIDRGYLRRYQRLAAS
jgi:selenide,water dikinase